MKPTKNRIFCIGCQRPKMLFETQDKADNFMRFNNPIISSKSRKVPTRSYYCSFCCGWHVTSSDDNQETASTKDQRDEMMWESIKIAQKGETLEFKPTKSKPTKPEPTPEESERQQLTLCITQNHTQIRRLLIQTDYDAVQQLIEESDNIYNHIKKLTETQGIDLSKLKSLENMIITEKMWLSSLINLQGNPEAQEVAIKQTVNIDTQKSYRNMILCLKSKESILKYIHAIENAVKISDFETAEAFAKKVEYISIHGFRGCGAKKIRGWAKQQLIKINKIIRLKRQD